MTMHIFYSASLPFLLYGHVYFSKNKDETYFWSEKNLFLSIWIYFYLSESISIVKLKSKVQASALD